MGKVLIIGKSRGIPYEVAAKKFSVGFKTDNMTTREIVSKIVGASNVAKFYNDLEIALEKGREIDRRHEEWEKSKDGLEFKLECEERNKRVMRDFEMAMKGEYLPIGVR